MIPVSTTYDNIIANGGSYEWRVYNNSTTFGKEHIVSGTIQFEGWNKQLIGNVISAQLNLTLWNVTIDTDYPIYMQFRATDGTNNSPWYANVGFYVDTMQTNPYTQMTEIVAFDSLLKAETDYMPSGSFVPITAKDLAEQIATDIGLTLDGSTKAWLNLHPYTFSNAPNVGVGGTTDKEMLSYIATIYGGDWIVRGNALVLVYPQYAPNDTANVGNAVSRLKRSDTETITRVKLWLDYETYFLAPQQADEDAWLALGGRCIEAHLPFYASQAVADNLASEYGIGGSNRAFIPYTADKVFIDPKYEIGDGITFATDALSFTSRIASMTVNIDPLAPSDLMFEAEDTLNSLYPYISRVERDMLYEIAQTQNTVANANSREQIIYISATSGTNTMSENTTWVTDASGSQNVWTTTRPVYDSAYPVLFVATQRQSVEQAGTTACSCTTPVKDQTTTVIDGGHITTGTIDAGVVTVTNINADNIVAGIIQDSSGENYWNLNTGQFVTQQGQIADFTIYDNKLEAGTLAVGNNATRIKNGEWSSTKQVPYSQGGVTTLYTHYIGINDEINFKIAAPNETLQTAKYAGRILPYYNQSADEMELRIYGGNTRMLRLIDGTNPTVLVSGKLQVSDSTNNKGGTVYGDLSIGGVVSANENLYITRSSGNSPYIYFTSGGSNTHAIFAQTATTNSLNRPDKFQFREYSYNSSTGQTLSTYERYFLPAVTSDKTSNSDYDILTTKTGIPSSYNTASSISDLNSKLLAVFNSINNGEVKYVRINPSQSISPFGVYVTMFTIYKINSTYGAIESISYQNAAGAVKHHASVWNGAISGWV